MTKKELKECRSVGMKWFLETYYDISDEVATLLSLHSHKSIKEAANLYEIKFLKIGFKDLTKEMVLTGEVILVQDHFGNIAPYINPLISLKDEYQTSMDEKYTSYEVYDINEGEDIYDKYQGRQKTK